MEQSLLIPDVTTKPTINKRVATLLVFVSTIIFYIYTLLPSLAWGDGTKLQSEAISGESFVLAEMNAGQFSPDPFIFARVGVAAWDHPLYIILGHSLVQAFPHVDHLWLVNLISAIFGAASVALVFLLCYQLTGSLLASGYAGFSLAVSHTFWWHSSTPEVYTLFTFLLLISVYLFDRFERTDRHALLLGSAFFFGLAASDHILAFLALPALVLYYLFTKGFKPIRLIKVRDLVYLSLGFLAGFSIYLIQFFRMFRNFNLYGLMGPVVGSTFISRLGTLSPILLGESLLSFLFLLIVQFNPIGVVLGGLGIQQLIPGNDLYSRKIIALCIAYTLFGIFYRVSDQFSFFLTSYVFWAILMGIGANRILSTLDGKVRPILISILILMILGTPFFYGALPGLLEKNGVNDASMGIPKIGTGVRDGLAYYINPNKRGDFNSYQFGSQTLAHLEPNSIVIAEWYTDTDEYFILRYFTEIKGYRSDVTVVGWPTQDPFSFDPQLVLKVIDDSFPHRPIYLASLSDKFYASSKLIEIYCIVPENNLYRLYEKGNINLQCLGKDSISE
jgi:hypothetical protein